MACCQRLYVVCGIDPIWHLEALPTQRVARIVCDSIVLELSCHVQACWLGTIMHWEADSACCG